MCFLPLCAGQTERAWRNVRHVTVHRLEILGQEVVTGEPGAQEKTLNNFFTSFVYPPRRPVPAGAVATGRGSGDGGKGRRVGRNGVRRGFQRCPHAKVSFENHPAELVLNLGLVDTLASFQAGQSKPGG